MANSFQNEYETPEITTLAELAESVIFRVPGCADVMVRKALRNVYRDFCRRSHCLVGVRQISLEYGVNRYPVLPTCGASVYSVRDIYINRRKIEDYRVIAGTPVCVEIADKYIVNNGEPQYAVVSTVEMPGLESEDIPVWFLEKYGDAIISGTIAFLAMMTNKPWSDPAIAGAEKIAYENAINDAVISVASGGVFANGGIDVYDCSNLL